MIPATARRPVAPGRPAPSPAPTPAAAQPTPGPAQSTQPSSTLRELAATLVLTFGPDPAPNPVALIEEQRSAARALLKRRLQAAPQTSFFTNPEQDLDRELVAVERQIAQWRTQGLAPITVLDPSYPEALKDAPDRPAMLFVAGRLRPKDLDGVAVIGSRAADRRELRLAGEIATALAAQRRTVISGLAAGIDTIAHTAALKRGGRTIAIIGTGLSRCYPRANVILQRRIAAECAVISPFLPDTAPSAETFPVRDALMAGLAAATVIVAAAATSELRAQAELIVARGRPLILLEPLLRHRWVRDVAAQPGVYVAETVDDVLAGLEP